MKQQTERRRSKKQKQKPSYATLRLRHGIPVNTDEIAENLLNDPDFAQGPVELQNEDIRELATTLANKRSIRYVMKLFLL